MNPVVIRDYRPEDRPAVVTLMHEFGAYLAWKDPLKRLRRPDEYGEHFTAVMERRVAQGDGVIVVADLNGSVAGFAAGVVEPADSDAQIETRTVRSGRILELYVGGRHHGNGIGSRLATALEGFFRARECDVVRAEVFAPNDTARSFYGALGFEERMLDLVRELDP